MYEQLITRVDEIIRTKTSTAIIFTSFQFMYNIAYIIETKNTTIPSYPEAVSD